MIIKKIKNLGRSLKKEVIMNKKLQELYTKFISLPEGINKNIAWARYHNYRMKICQQKMVKK
jgi:hypothetical protein